MTVITQRTIWNQRLIALDSFVEREGHALVPAQHVETVNNQSCELGSWVSYIRSRYRNGSLSADQAATMDAYTGWEWGPLRPGPKPDKTRDNEIKQMRSNGKSLQEIGTAYGLSRQRIHQIVTA